MTKFVKPFMHITLSVTAILAALIISANVTAEELSKVRIETSQGAIEITLRPDVAPQTVTNFIQYVEDGFYPGTIFHRVIPGFMIQTGGFDADLNRQPTRNPIPNEAKPTVQNLRGTVAMARTNAPDSATSQFFINLNNNGFLNAGVRGAGYAVFGKVTAGMGVVDAIAAIPTTRKMGMANVPQEPIIIQKAVMLPAQSD